LYIVAVMRPLEWNEEAKTVGLLVQALATKWSHWVSRRVETVRFLDASSLTRGVTIDIDTTALESLVPPEYSDSHVVIPLGILQKDLLVDFDLRASNGDSLSLMNRDEDSYFAWAWIMRVAQEIGIDPTSLPEVIHRRVYEIAHSFYGRPGPDLSASETWTDDEVERWNAFLNHERVNRLLSMLGRHFLPLCEIPRHTRHYLLKYEYRDPWRFVPSIDAGLAFTSALLQVPIRSVGLSRSYHLRVDLPSGMGLVGARLLESPPGSRPRRAASRAKSSKEPISHRRLLTRSRACFYFANVGLPEAPRDLWASVEARIPVGGFLRAVWVAASIAFVLTWLTGFYWRDLTTSKDAAVAFLLTIPLAIQGYLIRTEPHPVPSVVRRRVRYLGTLSFVATFAVAAGVILSDEPATWLLKGAGAVAATVWSVVTTLVWVTWRDYRRITKVFGRTIRVVKGEPSFNG